MPSSFVVVLYCCIVVAAISRFSLFVVIKMMSIFYKGFFGYSRLFRLISTCPKRFKPVYIGSNKSILAQTYQIGSKLSKLVKASLN